MTIRNVKFSFALFLLLRLSGGLSGFSLFSLDQNPSALNAGNIVSPAGARLLGMGGAGIALSDTLNYSMANPATIGAVDFTILSITYKPEITYLQEKNAGQASLNFSNDFPQAEIVVPLGKYGALFGGYKRGQLLDYDIRYTDDQGYLNHRYGSGGTYIAQGGYAFSFKRRLLLGVAFGGLYGDTRVGNFIEARPAGASRLVPSTVQKAAFNAKTMDAGVIYNRGKFSVAAAGSFPLTTTAVVRESQVIQNYTAEDSIVTKLTSRDVANTLPVSGVLGLAYTPSRRLKLALDVNGVQWDQPGRENEFRLSTGVEYFFSDTRSDNYFLNIPLRAGYYYHDLGLDDGIVEQALTLGWSLPTMGHFGYLNFAVEGGKRYKGSLSESGLTETFSAISIQLVHKGRWGRLRRAASDF